MKRGKKEVEATTTEAPVVKAPEEVVTISKADFSKLTETIAAQVMRNLKLNAPVSDDSKVLAKILTSVQDSAYPSPQLGDNVRPMDYDEFDMDDVLTEPVLFFTYSMGYMIMDATMAGRPVRTPYNRPFRFTHLYRMEKLGERNRKEYISLSVAKIASKKEAAWLRKHPLCGIKFFEDIRNAKNIDVSIQERLVEASTEIARLNEHEIVQRSLAEGLSPNMNVQDMKKALIHKIADQKMKNTANKKFEALEEMSKNAAQVGIGIGV